MDAVLTGLRAAAEPTRLRLLALLAQGDLTVTELTGILGQSQPRVSRHLKLMCDSGLLERYPEGAWVFYRLAAKGNGAELARALLPLLPEADATLGLDRQRLDSVRAARAARAQAYFTENAARWDEMRSLHADQAEVDRALVAAITGRRVRDLVDMGTGTGRVLQALAAHVEQGIGLDFSREMLAVARANLERAGIRNCMVRQGDITQLPLPAASADLVTIHQVLHYAAEPALVVAEAARVLRPGGLLVAVDLAPHDLEALRDQHAHRRLGFADSEVADWFRAAGLTPGPIARLPGHPLTVVLWQADKAIETAGARP
ncbi:metalloregulator ArsR/SmtB family transcription factor [Magnetospirillum sp. UT-4]|uniref:ArsR/SmtB family transcription factor n=1 Tax=Magnetospirillum sp. UT-4 TaxID=2681467 RepID=UPI00137D43F6|nr:metalloregulator ArsR/SmtB family transcription factor [Magnetospirillum sp. UT-4]CAA7619363.1 putative methyltransferase [Magnetospirillum sp. UT-4]